MGALRYALRQHLHNPGFTAVIVTTLAIGIGASTLLFSVVENVFLSALPYRDAERIVRLQQIDEVGNRANPSDPNFFDLKEQSRSFSALAQYTNLLTSVSGGDEPSRSNVANVSREFFDVMGVEPLLGRQFADEELGIGERPAAIVSFGYWQRYLGGDENVTARTLQIADRVHTIVGVMPRGFDYPEGAEIWIPRELWPASTSRTGHNFRAVGRLAPGVTMDAARAELGGIARRLKAVYGDDTWMSDVYLVTLREFQVGSVRPAMLTLAVAAGLLYFVACMNALSMFLSRSVVREQELAIRVAVGASRARIATQLFTEAAVVCLVAGLIGLLVASFGVDLLRLLQAGMLPRAAEIEVDITTIAFASALSLLAAGALSLIVTGRVFRHSIVGSTSRHARSAGQRSVLRDSLVAGQVALAVMLVVGVTLLGRSFWQLTGIEPGFRTDGLLLMNVDLPYSDADDQRDRVAAFYRDLIAELGTLPGAETVGGITAVPLSGGAENGAFVELDRPDAIQSFDDLMAYFDMPERRGFAEFRLASDAYFDTLEIPILRGRRFDASDVPDAGIHAAIVSQSLADARWPNQDAVGKLLSFTGMDGDYTPFRVVGVVGDVHEYGLDVAPRPAFYAYYLQRPRHLYQFWIAISGPAAETLAPAAREVVRRLDPELSPEIMSSETLYSASIAERRFNFIVLSTFGIAALALALAGIYGALSFNVAGRTREIGVRLALGARARSVMILVLSKSLWLAAAGIIIGLVLALFASDIASSLLFGVPPHDPLSYGLAALLLLVAAVLAAWIPARRAANVDPVVALRRE